MVPLLPGNRGEGSGVTKRTKVVERARGWSVFFLEGSVQFLSVVKGIPMECSDVCSTDSERVRENFRAEFLHTFLLIFVFYLLFVLKDLCCLSIMLFVLGIEYYVLRY